MKTTAIHTRAKLVSEPHFLFEQKLMAALAELQERGIAIIDVRFAATPGTDFDWLHGLIVYHVSEEVA